MSWKKIYFIVFFILILLMPKAFAEKYYSFRYKVLPQETFSLILKKFVPLNSIINNRTPMIIKMKRMNPHIKNWNKLLPGTQIQMYIAQNILDLKKYDKQDPQVINQVAIEKAYDIQKISYAKGFKSSIFYMASIGTFNQKSETYGNVQLYQNSPITLGFATSYYSTNSPFSTSASSYFSYFTAPTNKLTNEKKPIPPEIGFNIFQEYRYVNWNTIFYIGPDYEKLSLFKIDGIYQKSNNIFSESSILYLTIGFAKQFTFFEKKWFAKISVSQSTFSETKGLATDNSGSYSGKKFLFYLNYKLNDKLYLHTLLKYHSMTGPNDATGLRVGLGMGYILF